MKNKVKIAKRLLSILLVFLFSINSFAAIVSDNDGSAFVTKAEFEALKENFASQIKNYNDSIDGKIDGSIAAYLAGMKLASKDVLDSGIVALNSGAKESYKWWTDKILVDNSKQPKHGYFGGFGTITFGTSGVNTTSDGKTQGMFLFRYAVGDATYVQDDGTSFSTNYFAWYPATTKIDATYYESVAGNYGTYIDGDIYTCKYYKGFIVSNMTNTVIMDRSKVYRTIGPSHQGSIYMFAHFPENLCQSDEIGTNNSWNSQTFEMPWELQYTTSPTATSGFLKLTGWFSYNGSDIMSNPVTSVLRTLLVNNYKREKYTSSERYDITGVPLATDYSKPNVIVVDRTDWDNARLDNTSDREVTLRTSGNTRAYVAYWDGGRFYQENLSMDDTRYQSFEKQKYVWKHHPYKFLNTSDLVDMDASRAYGHPLKPNQGAYLLTAPEDGKVNFKMKFHSRDGSIKQVKFAVRDSMFTSATKLVSNIDTTYSDWTVDTENIIDISFDVKRNQEYFIQIEPVDTGKMIGVEQLGDIHFISSD